MSYYVISLQDLSSKLRSRNPNVAMTSLTKAYELAEEVHRNQKRDHGEAYFNHPLKVADFLIEECKIYDPDLIAVALLHDVLEDSPLKLQINDLFADKIVDKVMALTKPSKIFWSRNKKNEVYLAQIIKAGKEVILIKLVDRLQNLSELDRSPIPGKSRRYIAETEKLYLPLADEYYPSLAKRIREQIESLEERAQNILGKHHTR